MVEFSSGNPSKVFGKPYEVFDDKRFIARLPKPPYLFIDRITRVDPEPWVLTPDGWAEAEYEIPQDAWYFAANRMPLMPYCILLEIALQPCGWLAAYMGSALRSEQDLKFRNLGGQAVIHQDVLPDTGKLTTRTRLSRISEAGDMIIESFDFQVLSDRGPVYTGDTYFGFFTAKALEHQAGLTKPKHVPDHLNARNPTLRHRSVVHRFKDHSPLRPSHPAPAFIEGHVSGAGARRMSSFAMPAKALRMIDSIDRYAPAGGVAGLGYIEGTKTVDPREWFFDAHFYQDPVWPGSLGIECLYQLMKYMARDRWGALAETHLCSLITGASHRWTYRGQVIPESGTVRVSAVVTEIKAPPNPGIITDGYLQVDGRYIYKMQAFGLSLIPRK